MHKLKEISAGELHTHRLQMVETMPRDRAN